MITIPENMCDGTNERGERNAEKEESRTILPRA